jgi:hypothetical protein
MTTIGGLPGHILLVHTVVCWCRWPRCPSYL